VNEEFVAMANEDNRQEIIGKHLEEVCPGLKSERFTQAIKIGQTYQVQAETGVFDKEDSRFFDWAVWPVASDLSGGDGMVCMFTNITDRVMLQQQREDFVATLTHDLKTPILAANRALTLLMEGDFGDVSADQKEVLSTIHQSNDALYNLVLTLLDVYRYDSGAKSIEPAPNDLNDLVQRIGSEFKNASQQKKISLEISCPDEMKFVLIDAEEIRRVLQNFIDNSLKYSAAGASVVIRLSYSDKEALVTVEDTGRGISQEDKSKLFQRFWKSSSGGRYYASTGLGLYLCSRIIDQHQGRIWCDSVLGKGSTFGFAIPLMEI
jgi:Osmosensitive K+ channel histidine kinase